jgi:hypothetical protein
VTATSAAHSHLICTHPAADAECDTTHAKNRHESSRQAHRTGPRHLRDPTPSPTHPHQAVCTNRSTSVAKMFTWAVLDPPDRHRDRQQRQSSTSRVDGQTAVGSVAVISMNCSASSVPPGSVRSVSGTEQAELVSSLRQEAEACNVTPIVVRRWIATGWLHQPRWTRRQIHEVIDLGRTSNQVWGLAKTEEHSAAALEAGRMASRCDDLKRRTNATYLQGRVCSGCRAHQRLLMDRCAQGQHAFIVRAGAVVAAAEADIMESRPSFT